MIDYQPSQFAGVLSMDRDLLLENIVSTVKTAKAFDLPVVHSTINVATGRRATGESYTIVHHISSEDGDRKIMIASLRYLDTFAKIDGSWYFAERKLLLDWSETRPSTPGP